MADGWFRFYNTALEHPKVLPLSDAQVRAWLGLLSMASKLGGIIPDDFSLIATVLRKPMAKSRDLVQALLSANLLDRVDGGYAPHNWDTKQFKSDSDGADRAKRYRDRKRNVTESVTRNVTSRDARHGPETETETETEKKKDIAREARSAFEAFWKACPKKVGKGAAEKAFSKALKETSADLLTAAMARYGSAQSGKDPEFIAHPATWLNQKRWLDEAAGASNGATIHVLSDEVRQKELENLKKLGVI